MQLMAKSCKCMHQVTENIRFARYFRKYKGKFRRVLVHCGVVAFCVGWAAGCGSPPNQAAGPTTINRESSTFSGDSRTLRRGLPGEPRTLDPQVADDTFSFQVVRDLYEALTAEDRKGQIVPGVAKSWTVDTTGTVYTFQLRPDARWSDGRRVVAAEFVQGLRHAIDPKTASGSADLLSIIKGASEIMAGRKQVSDLGVVTTGELSLQIELEHPAPFILQILSQPIAAPLHLVTDASTTSAKSPPTNGPYVLQNRVFGSFIELARNPYYWDAPNVAIEHVRYVNAESEATELREYTAGQLDMTFTIPMPDLERISRKYGPEVQTAPILGTLYLALNLSRTPLSNSKDLRQALSMAVERELISERVMMGVTPAFAFVAKGITGYAPPGYEWSTWSRERRVAYARNLFARAGFSLKNPLHLKLYFNRDEGIQRIMVAIAANWKENLGVESELISDEFRVFLAGRKDRNRWDVARLGWNADYDDPASFLDVFAHDNSQNDPDYLSPRFNELIAKAKAEADQNKRVQFLRESEQVLLDDYPIIPVYFYKARRLVKPYLGGAEITPMNHTYSKHLFWQKAP